MVQVFILNIEDVDFEELLNAFAGRLPQQAIDKARRFKNQQDKVRSLCGEILSRWAMAEVSGFYPDKVFECNSNGKPLSGKPDLYFNISHSGDYVVVSVSDFETGVDIERLRLNKMKVAKRFFSDEEIRNIQMSEEPDARFSRYWSLKEAYLKYIGTGLTRELNSFTVKEIKNDSYSISEKDSEIKELKIFHQRINRNYFLSVCHRAAEKDIWLQHVELSDLEPAK
ncbi:MAG TPA: 4'-phosphopantetheinyl transferase superfamily protein [Bacteroidales bacterium]|nr:4'-phosphopantetheinyl transferase superfamily protein [Bacteroidales bacterium]